MIPAHEETGEKRRERTNGDMSANWGRDLWVGSFATVRKPLLFPVLLELFFSPHKQDQYDKVSTHLDQGIEFVKRIREFVKERAKAEESYAKELRYALREMAAKRPSSCLRRVLLGPLAQAVFFNCTWSLCALFVSAQ